MKERHPIIQEGYTAFFMGEHLEDNPYTDEHEYELWQTGWFQGNTEYDEYLETI